MITVETMKGRSGKQPQRRDRGSGGKPRRPGRVSERTPIGDPGADVEVELGGSGRTGARPKEGVAGAHRTRRGRSSAPTPEIPVSAGSAVAPTAKAEVRERERHRLQRQAGVVPAAEDGNPRQRRSRKATRAALDAAARKADRLVR